MRERRTLMRGEHAEVFKELALAGRTAGAVQQEIGGKEGQLKSDSSASNDPAAQPPGGMTQDDTGV
jgi:hypothetical protein